jgi:hypothetical protein
MMVNDLGQTFGSANTFNHQSAQQCELPALVTYARCGCPILPSAIFRLRKRAPWTIPDRRRRRQFLPPLLVQLTDTLRDLFGVARFAAQDRSVHATTTDEWVNASAKTRLRSSTAPAPRNRVQRVAGAECTVHGLHERSLPRRISRFACAMLKFSRASPSAFSRVRYASYAPRLSKAISHKAKLFVPSWGRK